MKIQTVFLCAAILCVLAGCSRSPETPGDAGIGTVARVISGEVPDDTVLTGADAVRAGGAADTAAKPIPADQLQDAISEMDFYVSEAGGIEAAISQLQNKENDTVAIDGDSDKEEDKKKKDGKDDESNNSSDSAATSASGNSGSLSTGSAGAEEAATSASEDESGSAEDEDVEENKDNEDSKNKGELASKKDAVRNRIDTRVSAIDAFVSEAKNNARLEDKDKAELTGSIGLKKDELLKKRDAVASSGNLAELKIVDDELSEMKIFRRELPKQKQLLLVYLGENVLNKKITPALLSAEKAIVENKKKNLPASEQEALLADARQDLIDAKDNFDEAKSELEGISPAAAESAVENNLKSAREYLKKIAEAFTGAKESLESLSSAK